MRILALSGSLRRDSLNTRLLRAAQELGGPGVEFLSYESLAAIPPFTQDLEHRQPAEVHELRQRIESADAVLIATPEYNGSIPGQLKNALDWVSRPLADSPFRGKPAAVIGASTSTYGAMWAQAELRKVLGLMGARVLEPEHLAQLGLRPHRAVRRGAGADHGGRLAPEGAVGQRPRDPVEGVLQLARDRAVVLGCRDEDGV